MYISVQTFRSFAILSARFKVYFSKVAQERSKGLCDGRKDGLAEGLKVGLEVGLKEGLMVALGLADGADEGTWVVVLVPTCPLGGS